MSKTAQERGTVVAVGSFDGVHQGHQALLDVVNRVAREETLERVVYAFRFPPRLVLYHASSGRILPEPRKIELLHRWVDRVIPVDFLDVADLSARRFVTEQLVDTLRARAIVVGEGFRFGHGRRGDGALLQRIGVESGTRIEIVPPLQVDGAAVSSTRIRRLLAAGRVDEAARLLGRYPLLIGRVVSGDRLGRQLGYPTANLRPDPAVLLPAAGLYAAHARSRTDQERALLYVGTRPTLVSRTPPGRPPRCEVHLLSPPAGDLYGEVLEVELVKRLRSDRAFPSLDALRAQMDKDATAARALLDSPAGGTAEPSAP